MRNLTKVGVAVAVLVAIGLVGSAIAGAMSTGNRNGHEAKLERAPGLAVRKKAPSKTTATVVTATRARVRNARSTAVDNAIATTNAQPVTDEPEVTTDDSSFAPQDDQAVANAPANNEEEEDEQPATLDDEAADDAEDEAEDDDVDQVDVEDQDVDDVDEDGEVEGED